MRADAKQMIEKLDASTNEQNELSKNLKQTIERGNAISPAQMEKMEGVNNRMQEAYSEMRVYSAWLASSETEDELPDAEDITALRESQDRFIIAIRLTDTTTQQLKKHLGMIP